MACELVALINSLFSVLTSPAMHFAIDMCQEACFTSVENANNALPENKAKGKTASSHQKKNNKKKHSIKGALLECPFCSSVPRVLCGGHLTQKQTPAVTLKEAAQNNYPHALRQFSFQRTVGTHEHIPQSEVESSPAIKTHLCGVRD